MISVYLFLFKQLHIAFLKRLWKKSPYFQKQGRLFAKDVDYEKIRTRTIKFLWRVLDSSKNGSCLLSKLQGKYLSLIGELIPHLKLGYKDLESFIRDIPDLVSIEEDGWGNKVVMIKDKIKVTNLKSVFFFIKMLSSF